MREILLALHGDESGQDVVEYALLLVLLGLAIAAFLPASDIVKAFSSVGSLVSSSAT